MRMSILSANGLSLSFKSNDNSPLLPLANLSTSQAKIPLTKPILYILNLIGPYTVTTSSSQPPHLPSIPKPTPFKLLFAISSLKTAEHLFPPHQPTDLQASSPPSNQHVNLNIGMHAS